MANITNRQLIAVFAFVVFVGVCVYLPLFWAALGGKQSDRREQTDKDLGVSDEIEIAINQGHSPSTPSTSVTNSTPTFNVSGRGFWEGMGASQLHIFDEPLAREIIRFLKAEQVETVLELGAGMGLYAKLLMEHGFHVSCYDGNPQTQDLSLGKCATVDLTKKVDFVKHEWTMSLEVGEHIPPSFEATFLSNLNRGTRNGMILSWAVEGQGGTSHVNNRNNTYIREKLSSMGYKPDRMAENRMRNASDYSWFKNTIMVFRSRRSAADELDKETTTPVVTWG